MGLRATGSNPKQALRVLLITACPVQSRGVERCFGGIQRWTQIVARHGLADHVHLHFVDTAIWNISRFREMSAWAGQASRALRILASLLRQLAGRRFDLVHINCSITDIGLLASCIYARLVRFRRLPLAIHYHGEVPAFVRGVRGRARFRRLVRMSEANIVLDPNSCEWARKIAGPNGRVFQLPNFIEDDVLRRQGRSPQGSSERVRVLFTGQVKVRKGCIELLEAARQMGEADFVLLGVVDKDMDERLGDLPANVRIVDQVPQDVVLQEMSASDIFVLPSWTEGFPMAALEAMAVGLPVVATRAGALPDMIEDGKGGVVVPRRDLTALVSALRSLTGDPARRERMGAFNREKVRKEYVHSVVAPQLTAIYEGIASATSDPAATVRPGASPRQDGPGRQEVPSASSGSGSTGGCQA